MAAGTLGAVITFGSSDALGGAYGIAVSMLMAVTTVLAGLVALHWGFSPLIVAAVNGFFLIVDLVFVGANAIKLVEGGWFLLLPDEYKQLLVSQTSSDLMYTGDIAGVPANWMTESIRRVGLDPDNLPKPLGRGMRHDHLPDGVTPWKNLWSAGQGVDLIEDVPTVAELVRRLRAEYVAACEAPSFVEAARLADRAVSTML